MMKSKKLQGYVHPKKYRNFLTGTTLNNERVQNRYRWLVENYCIRCSAYTGKDHDYYDLCSTQKGKMLTKCPKEFGKIVIPNDDDIVLMCEVEK